MSNALVNSLDINPQQADNIVAFLNSAQNAREIAAAGERNGGRYIGLGIAQKIVELRDKLGRFSQIDQVATVPGIKEDQFGELVHCLGEVVFTPPEKVIVDDTDTFDTNCGNTFSPLVLGGESAKVTMKVKNTKPKQGEKKCRIKVELVQAGSRDGVTTELDPGLGTTIRAENTGQIQIT